MPQLVVTNHLTLDGVMQSPADPGEDTRGGFEHGGWAAPRSNDPVMAEVLGVGMRDGGNLLFGRLTYEKMAAHWPKQTDGNPFTPVLDASQKYVASRTLKEPLEWENSTVLEGDVTDAVAALKERTENDIVVLGSGDLLQSLMPRQLVDRWVLMIHPVVLGSGRRLFADGATFAELRLVDSVTTTTGVVIATYES
jgi:dihydrofolate reductase